MPTYVTVSQGEPGEELTPILASTDPYVVAQVVEAMTRAMVKRIRPADPEPEIPEA